MFRRLADPQFPVETSQYLELVQFIIIFFLVHLFSFPAFWDSPYFPLPHLGSLLPPPLSLPSSPLLSLPTIPAPPITTHPTFSFCNISATMCVKAELQYWGSGTKMDVYHDFSVGFSKKTP